MTTYSTGTVSVTNGSTAVTGVSTAWVNGIVEGDLFALTLAGPFYEIVAINDDTSITLDRNYAGATQSGQAYSILRLSTTRQTNNYLAAQVQNLIDLYKVNPSMVGGTIDATVIGANQPAAADFTDVDVQGTLEVGSNLTLAGSLVISGNIFRPDAAGGYSIGGGTGTSDGSFIQFFGEDHSTGGDIAIYGVGADLLAAWDESVDRWLVHKNMRFMDYDRLQLGQDGDLDIYSDNSNPQIIGNIGEMQIGQNVNGGRIALKTKDSGGLWRDGIVIGGATPNVSLRYAEDEVARTRSNGLTIQHGSTPRLYINDESGSTGTAGIDARLLFSGPSEATSLGYLGFPNNDDMHLENSTAAGNLIINTPNNASGIVYFRIASSEKMRVDNTGVLMGDGDRIDLGNSRDMRLYHDGTTNRLLMYSGNLTIDGKMHGGQTVAIRMENSSGTLYDAIRGVSSGADVYAALHYNGATRVQTTSSGTQFNGTVYAPNVYSNTTGGAANLHIGTSGQFFRSTSVAAAKDIQPGNRLTDLLAIVMGANPILYKSKLKDDNPDLLHWGLVAEEVAELDSALVHWQDGEYIERKETIAGDLEALTDDDGNIVRDEDGDIVLVRAPDRIETRLEFSPFDKMKPAGVQYERFTVPLIAVAQHHQRAIETLAEAVGAIVDPLGDTLTKAHLAVERERRLAAGFEYDFGDERGVHEIGTTPADRRGWDEVTTGAQAAIALGEAETEFEIVTNTGAITVTATEWMQVLAAATRHRQPIWKAFFGLSALPDVPEDYANDNRWLTIAA